MTRKTFPPRLACLTATAALVSSFAAAHEASAQPTYERRKIVEVNEKSPRPLEPDEVPINFRVPEPDVGGHYRSLRAIRSLLDKRGQVGAIASATLGQSRPGHPGPIGRIPSHPITEVTVRAKVQFQSAPALPLGQRPDGTPKGKALVVGGVHSREWAAIESQHDLTLRIQAEDALGRELDSDPRTVVEWDRSTEQLVGYERAAPIPCTRT